jgi:colicin import membrane protein
MPERRSVRIFATGGNSLEKTMKNIWVAGLALAVGCAMGGQSTRKSETMTAQDQAHQSLQQAADAQKKANEEQAKAEQAQADVTQKQKELADAQAKLRGQRAKAQQAQRDAEQLTKAAQEQAMQQQQQAQQLQQTQAQQAQSLNQDRQQSWTQQKDLTGTVVQAQGDSLQVRDSSDQQILQLQLTDATALTVNGQSGQVSQIQPGSDVRASYQVVDGQAKALKIDVTSKSGSSSQSQQK